MQRLAIFIACLLILWPSSLARAQYAGGTGDGWSAVESTALGMAGGVSIALASSTNQGFVVGQPATGMAALTLTDVSGSVTAANDIRIHIPDNTAMTWDTSAATAVIGGTGAASVAAAVSYAGAGKVLVLDVTADLAAGQTITISGLSFTNFTAASTEDYLWVDVLNTGAQVAADAQFVMIRSAASAAYLGGAGDGWSITESAAQALSGGPNIALSSSVSQTFIVGQSAAGMAALTLTDVGGSVTAANDIRIHIPDNTAMSWDTSIATAVIGGTGAARVAAAVSYTGAGKVLVLDVSADLAAGQTLTISGLSFTNFTAVSNEDYLWADVTNTGLNVATDPQFVMIRSAGSGQYRGGDGDGWAAIDSADLAMVGPHYDLASAENQTFIKGQAATAIQPFTLLDYNGTTTAALDLRIVIPDAFPMTWDTSDTTAVISGTGAGKVATGVAYENAGKVLVLDVTGDFTAGQAVTVSGLSFTNFLAMASDAYLWLDAYNYGTQVTQDIRFLMIRDTGSEPYCGGANDGWAMAESGVQGLSGGATISLSSALSQTFLVNQAAAAAATITFTDAGGATTADNDIRIHIPDNTAMTWDTTDTEAVIGGPSAARVSPVVSYEDGGKVLLLNVINSLAAGNSFTVSGLAFANFTAVSSEDYLWVDIYHSGSRVTADPNFVMIRSATGGPYIGGSGDGWAALDALHFDLSISSLAFTTTQLPIFLDNWTSLLTVQTRKANGSAVNVLADMTLNLFSSSSGGTFASSPSSLNQITSVTIPAGQSSASFYYKDTVAGNATLVVSETPSMGWLDAEQTVAVRPTASSFAVTAASPQVAGKSFTLTVSAFLDDGTPAVSFNEAVDLGLDFVSPASGSGTLSAATITGFTNGIATLTNLTYPDCGSITIKAVKKDNPAIKGVSTAVMFYPYDFNVEPSGLDQSGGMEAVSVQTAAKPFALKVTARNAAQGVCPNYTGVAHLTATHLAPAGNQGESLAVSSLTSSLWTEGVANIELESYDKWGSVTITATDSMQAARKGSSGVLMFVPKDFALTVAAPPASRTWFYAHELFAVTLTARDFNGVALDNYAGSVALAGVGLTLPAAYTFLPEERGAHVFQGVYGSADARAVLVAADQDYPALKVSSPEIVIREGFIKIISATGTVGSVGVTAQVQDAEGQVLVEDNATVFKVTLYGAAGVSKSVSDAVDKAVIVSQGQGLFTVTSTEPETVTVTPLSVPELTAIPGTVTFGSLSSSNGVAVQFWREINSSLENQMYEGLTETREQGPEDGQDQNKDVDE